MCSAESRLDQCCHVQIYVSGDNFVSEYFRCVKSALHVM